MILLYIFRLRLQKICLLMIRWVQSYISKIWDSLTKIILFVTLQILHCKYWWSEIISHKDCVMKSILEITLVVKWGRLIPNPWKWYYASCLQEYKYFSTIVQKVYGYSTQLSFCPLSQNLELSYFSLRLACFTLLSFCPLYQN